MELSRAKAEEIRGFERKWREVAMEQRRAEAERLRVEAAGGGAGAEDLRG